MQRRRAGVEPGRVIAELGGVLLPVLALATLGYIWRRLGIPFEREFVTRVIMNLSGPCLIVDSLSRLTLPAQEFLYMIAAAATMFVVTAVVAFGILRAVGLSVRSYLPALAIGNNGNLGLPLCLFAFGQEGLGLAVAVYVTGSVGQFTLTPLLQSRASPWRTLATTPVIYAAAIGSVALAGDIELPAWISETIGLLGGLMIPLMLLALGNTLGGLHAKRLPFACGWGAVRLLLGFGVAYAVATAFGLEGIAKGVIVLQGAMPTAIFSYLFAVRYDRHADDVAGIVLASTILSALSLPFLVAYLLGIAG